MPAVSGSGVPPNPRFTASRAETPPFDDAARENRRPAPAVERIRPPRSFRPFAFVIFWLVAAGALYFCYDKGVFSLQPSHSTSKVSGNHWHCDLGYSYCPEDLWKRAESLIKAKRWREASQLLHVALQHAPRRNICRNFRKIMAICLTKSAQYRRAISEFLGVIREGGGDEHLYHHLGHAYAGVGSVAQAIQAFKEAIRLNPVARHYICGARVIIQAARQSGSQDFFPLARRWADQAAHLGGDQKEVEVLHTSIVNR